MFGLGKLFGMGQDETPVTSYSQEEYDAYVAQTQAPVDTAPVTRQDVVVGGASPIPAGLKMPKWLIWVPVGIVCVYALSKMFSGGAAIASPRRRTGRSRKPRGRGRKLSRPRRRSRKSGRRRVRRNTEYLCPVTGRMKPAGSYQELMQSSTPKERLKFRRMLKRIGPDRYAMAPALHRQLKREFGPAAGMSVKKYKSLVKSWK